jgi:hypothetical protein
MFPLLYKYLMLHDQVCIPGIGRFYKSRQASVLDFANKVFQPPVYTIAFAEEAVAADKRFYAFAGKEQGIDEVEAIRHFHDFAYRLKQHINDTRQIELPGIGHLERVDGKLSFTANNIVEKYYPSVKAERIVRQDAEHTIMVGDSELTNTQMQVMLDAEDEKKKKGIWWIIAIVLALIAVAAIVYYYMNNGNVRL